jgi:hypothetical protein
MGQVTTGATTHYPNLLPAALMNAGYAVGANVPGSLAGSAAATAPSGYVLRMRNLPPGTAKFDIVQARPAAPCMRRGAAPPAALRALPLLHACAARLLPPLQRTSRSATLEIAGACS